MWAIRQIIKQIIITIINMISLKQAQNQYNNTQNTYHPQPLSNSPLAITLPFLAYSHHPKSLFQNEKSAKEQNGTESQQNLQFCEQKEGSPMLKKKVISDGSQSLANSKLNAHREKFIRIKAKQLQLKKKAESILSNSSSSNSTFKLKTTQSNQNPLIEKQNQLSMSPTKKDIYTFNAFKSNKKHTLRIKNNFRVEVFHVIKFINEGCYGKVYLIMHDITRLIFCLKMIDRNFFDQFTFNQLIREIKIQSFVSHPNIVNFYQFFVDENYVYLLLEPCLGGNLYQLMSKTQKKCLQQKQAKRYIKQIGKAIQYLHKQSIIHRDIKPQNVLIHQNSAKLCDFGWAVYSPLMRDTQCGTPLYACPQIIKNESYDSKIDIWCIGVLTFELLYGQPPFKIRNINDMAKIVNEEINFTNEVNISESAVDFIKGCLQKKAVRRFQIRKVLEHAFLIPARADQRFRNTIA